MDGLVVLVVFHFSRFGGTFIGGDACWALLHEFLLHAAATPFLPCTTTRAGSGIQVFG
jgi:hypothetical protein